MDVNESSAPAGPLASELRALQRLSAIEDEDDFATRACAQPALLAVSIQQVLASAVWAGAQGERKRLEAGLAQLQSLRLELEAKPGRYRLGAAPLERIYDAVDNGSIGNIRADELARANHRAVLASSYVRALTIQVHRGLSEGNWRNVVPLQRIVMLALDARPGAAEADDAGREVLLDVVFSMTTALFEIGEPWCYGMGLKVGTRLADWARANGDDETLGESLHRLGTLHSDPWKRWQKDELGVMLWQARAIDEHVLGGRSGDSEQLPTADAALTAAAEYLREAAPLRTGEERAWSLAALAGTLRALKELGRPVDREEIAAVAREAFENLPDEARVVRLDQAVTLRSLGQDIGGEVIEAVFAKSLDHWVLELGPMGLVELARVTSDLLAEEKPERALGLLRGMRPLLAQGPRQEPRQEAAIKEARLIVRAFAPGMDSPVDGTTVEAATRAAEQRWQEERWDVQRIAATMFALALQALGDPRGGARTESA